jgi:uncharacterized repeat protein (TIGR02543 family)
VAARDTGNIMDDNVPPSVTLKNPSANEARVQSLPLTVQIVCRDDNGIDSVRCVLKGAVLAVSKAGHTFSGWSTNSTGSAKTYRGDGTDTLKMPLAPVTLYAKWVIDTFTVTFISTGTTAFQTQKIAYNSQATLPITQPVLAGSAFEGWFTTNDVSGVSFDFSSPVTVNRTLYAKWAPVYSVIYQASGGSGSVPVDNKKYKNGEQATVLGNTGWLTKANSDFAGWTVNDQGTGTVYNAGDRVTVGSGNFNLYAKWMCTITFDGQGATTAHSPATKKIDISTAIGTLPTDPQKTCYVFDGWYTNVSNPTTKINAATTFSGNTTVYAKWVIKDADENIYTEVKIGNQVWMVENLKTTKFNTGVSIPHVPDSAYWWNTTKAMASNTDWYPSDYVNAVGNNLVNNNKSRFSALPSGKRNPFDGFSNIGKACYWGSTTVWNYDDGGILGHYLSYEQAYLPPTVATKQKG